MIEVFGDLWTYDAPVKCITTNGYIRKDGKAVMGRGVALQAAQRWPELPKVFGLLLRPESVGNHVMMIGGPPWMDIRLYSFPVKHNYWEKADLELIERSAKELVMWAADEDEPIVLPRPGCGNGQLTWEEVKPVIEPILDDRFHVIDRL